MTLERINRLQQKITPGHYFYVTNLVNIRYLTGFTGSNAALLVSDTNAILATDSRYEIQVTTQVPDLPAVIGRDFPQLLLGKLQNSEVLVEGGSLPIDSYEKLTANFGHKFSSTSGVIEALRVVKDFVEIELIKQACEISTRAYLDVIDSVQIGQSEKSIRNVLEQRHIRGCEQVFCKGSFKQHHMARRCVNGFITPTRRKNRTHPAGHVVTEVPVQPQLSDLWRYVEPIGQRTLFTHSKNP